jgi:hypothetical protein
MNYNSDFDSSPRYYSRYHRINSVPEALFLIEAECFDTPTDTATRTGSLPQGVIFGWGILSFLLIIGGFQFSHSQDVAPVSPQISTSNLIIAPQPTSNTPHSDKYRDSQVLPYPPLPSRY